MNSAACADCGDVLPISALTWYGLRPLCPACAHDENDHAKQDAERWILEQMFLITRVLAASDPHACSTGTLTTRVQNS